MNKFKRKDKIRLFHARFTKIPVKVTDFPTYNFIKDLINVLKLKYLMKIEVTRNEKND